MIFVVSSNGVNIIAEDADYFYCIPPSYAGDITKIKKKQEPLWRVAAEAKWGYIPLKKEIAVEKLRNITDDMLVEFAKQRKWERDYVS